MDNYNQTSCENCASTWCRWTGRKTNITCTGYTEPHVNYTYSSNTTESDNINTTNNTKVRDGAY